MKTTNKIAFVLFLIIAILEAVIGVRYLIASEPMPYHMMAMGDAWSTTEPIVQFMYIMLEKGSGLGSLMTFLAVVFLLFIPFRRGENWSRWALMVLPLIHNLFVVWIIITVMHKTEAKPPLNLASLGIILSIIAFFLSSGIDNKQSNQSNQSNQS
ncbi:MAG: hypothetical protein GY754_39365 [bacterium]|nr:hypothetical protein [bacterium]